MIPSTLIPQLANDADAALLPILRNGASHFGQSRPTDEVGFIAAAVLGGVPAIARTWKPTLQKAGFQLHIHGVFCHKSPQATFKDNLGVNKSCELADLLVVVDDLTPGGAGQRWAVLIQAKIAKQPSKKTISSEGDLRQLDLLTRWPLFSLPANYQPGDRDFSTCKHAGQPLDCGRYGLITPQPTTSWHQQTPANRMPASGVQLGAFLAHMLESGQTGFGREASGNRDDWSRTVEELLTVTYKKLFNYVTGFGPGNSKKRGHLALAYAAVPWGPWRGPRFFPHAPPPPSGGEPDWPEEDEDEGGGISFLRIGISRSE
jgi:hypothetical protein